MQRLSLPAQGPSASWITAGMLLRMRRPRAAASLGGRWAEGVLTVRTEDPVAHAVRVMAAHNVGCLVVMSAADEVAGVITERTYSRRIILEGRDSDSTRVGEVMKSAIVCVNAEEKLDVVASVFSQRAVRHLPVVGGENMMAAPGPDHILACARARVVCVDLFRSRRGGRADANPDVRAGCPRRRRGCAASSASRTRRGCSSASCATSCKGACIAAWTRS